jgi:hypothetical protein
MNPVIWRVLAVVFTGATAFVAGYVVIGPFDRQDPAPVPVIDLDDATSGVAPPTTEPPGAGEVVPPPTVQPTPPPPPPTAAPSPAPAPRPSDDDDDDDYDDD